MSKPTDITKLPASWRLRAISLEQTGMTLAPQVQRAYDTGTMPPLLEGPQQ